VPKSSCAHPSASKRPTRADHGGRLERLAQPCDLPVTREFRAGEGDPRTKPVSSCDWRVGRDFTISQIGEPDGPTTVKTLYLQGKAWLSHHPGTLSIHHRQGGTPIGP
jgi:hypothetical protein